MNPSQIERITLSSIKDTSHLLYLQQEHDIAETHFAFFPDEAQYIYKYTRDYGEAPPAVILEANFFPYLLSEWFGHSISIQIIKGLKINKNNAPVFLFILKKLSN